MKFFFLSFALASCNFFSQTHAPASSPTPPILSSLVSASNPQDAAEKINSSEVPFQLYRILAREPKNTNFSPLSLKIAFSLVYPGSRESTQKLFEDLFGFNSATPNPLRAEYDLSTKITAQKSENQELLIQNSAWFANQKALQDSFKESLKTQDAFVGKINIDEMNAWAAKSTHDRIKKLITSVDPKSRAIFINSIFLKQKWLLPFENQRTNIAHFQSTPSFSEKVPTLHSEMKVRYYQDEKAKWIALPYENSPLVMYLALPLKRFNLAEIDEALSSKLVTQVSSQMKEADVIISIPKFNLTQTQSFKDLMIQAQFGEIFRTGDYSGIMEKPKLELSDIIQAASISITESGTEAGAATAIQMLEAGYHEPLMTKSFTADQPFLFLLRNDETKEIYWIGRIYSPLDQ